MTIVLREELGRQQARVGREILKLEALVGDKKPSRTMTEEQRIQHKHLRQARESFVRLETTAIALGSLQLGDIDEEITSPVE